MAKAIPGAAKSKNGAGGGAAKGHALQPNDRRLPVATGTGDPVLQMRLLNQTLPILTFARGTSDDEAIDAMIASLAGRSAD